MPSISSDFNQILNIASSGHMHTIQNVVKDTSPSQEHLQSSSTPAKTPEMSSIFDRILDAFKLNRFQPNFKQGFLRVYADHPKRHQEHQPQSGTSTIIINSSKNSLNVIHLWQGFWCLQTQQISTKFYTGLPQSICRPSKISSRTPAPVKNIHNLHQLESVIFIIIMNSSNFTILWMGSWCLETQQILIKF